MNKEEILAMEAGFGLDKLIDIDIFKRDLPILVYRSDFLFYSTDISAAWQVVEKMNDWSYLPILWSGITETGYLLKFAFSKSFTQHAHADCTSLNKIPEAICKAALLAKLEKGD